MQPNSDNKVPVALFSFNRPDFTRQVMEQIRVYAPPVIFLIQDGPRRGAISDLHGTAEVRRILESVNWNCKIYRLYSDENLGLLERFDSGLKYIFSKVECCIILEDDVLPSQDFFRFAAAALEDFRTDKRIGMISGYCETTNRRPILGRYFSRKPKVWGWATWSDRLVDFDPKQNYFSGRSLLSSFHELKLRHFSFFESLMWRIRMGRATNIGTWDYQWSFHVLFNYGYCLASSTNLIKNLGFGLASTNTVLVPPFINFDVKDTSDWQLDRSVPKKSSSLDIRETVRRFTKMLTPAGIRIVVRKLGKY